MFGLADLKKINERAAEKANQRHSVTTAGGARVLRNSDHLAHANTIAVAQEIADALNLADAVAEANANAVGRT